MPVMMMMNAAADDDHDDESTNYAENGYSRFIVLTVHVNQQAGMRKGPRKQRMAEAPSIHTAVSCRDLGMVKDALSHFID